MHNVRRYLAAAALTALALGTSGCVQLGDAETATFNKDYTVRGPVTLDIQNGSGDVSIIAGSAGRVRVRGEVRLSEFLFASGTRRRIEEITEKPPITQTGDLLRFARATAENKGSVRINYVIEAPANTEVRLRNGSGDVVVRSVEGPLNIDTSSGDIELANIAKRVEASAGSGDVVARDVPELVVSTRSGDVEIFGASGDTRIETTSGDVRFERPGGRVQVRTSSGDVDVDGARADLRVTTGSGGVHIIGDPPTGSSWEVDTRSGQAVLDVPERASFQLAARSRSDIECDVEIAVEERTRRELRGRVGKGDARVRVETGSGRIRIR